MKKAYLYCPSEQAFINGLLVNKPVLPGQGERKNTTTSPLEVSILGDFGERSLILLPNILARTENETVLMDNKYISLLV